MRKRLFDILFSIFALTIGFPVFFTCALLIKLSSQGPIFYKCTRIGRQRVPFTCWKFRTMFFDAEQKLQCLLKSDPLLMQEWKTYYKLKHDPRITPIGKWLRKTSLDELPQFWNVLKGDMSVVGPRPLTEYELTHYLKEKAPKILSVRPGLTSIWAIKGRNQLSLLERIQFEEFYIDNRSFSLDCRLVLQTAAQMIFPRGSF